MFTKSVAINYNNSYFINLTIEVNDVSDLRFGEKFHSRFRATLEFNQVLLFHIYFFTKIRLFQQMFIIDDVSYDYRLR